MACALKPAYLLKGMHGMGDNLHQRALVRKLMITHTVWLETSWASIYHDLIEQGLIIIRKTTPLRTQTKNAVREAGLFYKGAVPQIPLQRQVRYSGELVRQHGSVLNAMIANFGLSYSDADFRLPVPDSWLQQADALIAQWRPTKPILIYRPLVLRREWFHTERNPDFASYAALFQQIRDRFFVVSIADLVPNVEWIVGEPVTADIQFHHGELQFETLAALIKRAAMVYGSPGFVVPLAQAVGTPVSCMFGGFENSASFSSGAKFTPYLGLDVDHPCFCFCHTHACDKTMDFAKASGKMKAFLDAIASHCKIPTDAVGANLPAAPLPAAG